MMNTKYFFTFIESAKRALIKYFFLFKCSFGVSSGGSVSLCNPCFIFAKNRTIFPFFRNGIKKYFTTINTFIFNSTIRLKSSFIIAFSRTIFGCITSSRNMCKCFTTNFTIFSYSQSRMQSLTFSRTKKCNIFSIFSNCKNFVTLQTFYFNFGGFFHAT
jgi:hypothetical protein